MCDDEILIAFAMSLSLTWYKVASVEILAPVSPAAPILPFILNDLLSEFLALSEFNIVKLIQINSNLPSECTNAFQKSKIHSVEYHTKAALSIRKKKYQEEKTTKNFDSTPRAAYSVKEAAQALGMSHQTIYTLIHSNDFPAVKIGGRTLVPVAALNEWLEQKMQSGQRPGGRT